MSVNQNLKTISYIKYDENNMDNFDTLININTRKNKILFTTTSSSKKDFINFPSIDNYNLNNTKSKFKFNKKIFSNTSNNFFNTLNSVNVTDTNIGSKPKKNFFLSSDGNTCSTKKYRPNFKIHISKFKSPVFNSNKCISKFKKKLFSSKKHITNKDIIEQQFIDLNGNLNLNLIKNNTINTTANDYSLIMKKLDRWDKDNCSVKQYDPLLLYNYLINYYKDNNLIEDIKNLDIIQKILQSGSNYNKLVKNRLKLGDNLLSSDYSIKDHNANQSNIYKNKNSYDNQKKFEKLINDNKGYKLNGFLSENDSRILSLKNINLFNMIVNNVNKSVKLNGNEYVNKLMKEKVKYETQLHNDLLYVNKIIFNKKAKKEEKDKLVDGIYNTKYILKHNYEEKYSFLVKEYLLKYDEFQSRYRVLVPDINQINQMIQNEKNEEKKEKEKEKEDDKNETNNDVERKNTVRRKTSRMRTRRKDKKITKKYKNYLNTIQLIKDMDFIKKTKLYTMNTRLREKLAKLMLEYKDNITKLDEEKTVLEKDIDFINRELSFYKQVNHELLRETKNYYLDILKKGNDYRNDGLVWIVKNLIEIGVNLEYQHFPKYLTNEQIDYLKNLATLILEQSELNIILKVLKKKQIEENLNSGISNIFLNKLIKNEDETKVDNNDKETLGDGTDHIKFFSAIDEVRWRINKKFYKIYKNNEEALRNFYEKDEENIKLKNALEQIKRTLYHSGNGEKKNHGVLDEFMGAAKNKDFFSFILEMRNKFNELGKTIEETIAREKKEYLDQLNRFNNSSSPSNNKFNMFYKDVIKKSLFGIKCDI